MGQYYKPAILAKNKKTVLKFLTSWSFENGAKLMEHSWLGNNLVRAFESLIYKKPQIVVWAGDYADQCSGRKSNVYDRCLDKLEVKPETNLTDTECRFIVNHSKKLFVDTTKVKPITANWAKGHDYRIHPLPLLTCEGNGRGGGDFGDNDGKNIVGSWARNLISVEEVAPEGYTELEFNLIER